MSTILVVDDDKTFTGLIERIFGMEGHRTVVVHEPDGVLAAARREQPDLILMDVHIKDRDTFAALRALRADAAFESVPVVMASGMDHSAECKRAGATRFLLKPFQPFDLLDLIKELT